MNRLAIDYWPRASSVARRHPTKLASLATLNLDITEPWDFSHDSPQEGHARTANTKSAAASMAHLQAYDRTTLRGNKPIGTIVEGSKKRDPTNSKRIRVVYCIAAVGTQTKNPAFVAPNSHKSRVALDKADKAEWSWFYLRGINEKGRTTTTTYDEADWFLQLQHRTNQRSQVTETAVTVGERGEGKNRQGDGLFYDYRRVFRSALGQKESRHPYTYSIHRRLGLAYAFQSLGATNKQRDDGHSTMHISGANGIRAAQDRMVVYFLFFFFILYFFLFSCHLISFALFFFFLRLGRYHEGRILLGWLVDWTDIDGYILFSCFWIPFFFLPLLLVRLSSLIT